MSDLDRPVSPIGAPDHPLRQPLIRRVKRRHIQAFMRQCATLLTAGLSIDRAMELLSRQHDAPALAGLAGAVADRIRHGGSLSEAMAAEPGVFDDLDISVITAAETSGRMGEAMSRLAEHHERRDAVSQKIRSALVYPLVLVVAAAVAITVLFVVVVPGLAPLLAGAEADLPATTRAVLAISHFLLLYGWIIPAVLLALLLANALPQGRRARDRFCMSLPIIGPLWAKIETERWERGLGILLANGVVLPEAVRVIAGSFSNQTLRASGARIATAIPEGRGLAVLMAECGCFPAIAVHLVRVGEETGGLDAMLIQAANYQRDEVEHTLTRLIGLIEPVLILVLGLTVAGVVFALLATVASLSEALV
ncbi:MAG: type II secretion system F family protein [Proteobacteria bacterium]|nr:type II secretion system F family protein [Pseudomonadota bacterium]MDA1309248.1 type II secretion system F family protein [Pseudomonadota bacterium]